MPPQQFQPPTTATQPQQRRPRSVNAFSLCQASGYVLSGCSQPLLVQWLRGAGLADAKAQLYMWFYYLGPASVLVPMMLGGGGGGGSDRQQHHASTSSWPSSGKLVRRAVGIALFDTASASMNYAGAALAGPLVFAVIYSSVTVWTAVFSRYLLRRRMTVGQWGSVFVVFLGLAVTARDSRTMGNSVWLGCVLVLVGSMMHALTYVLCEAIMTVGTEVLTVTQNTGIQSGVALAVLGLWQLVYTVPNWTEAIAGPLEEAGTTLATALFLLGMFAFCNWVHCITFYTTLIEFPGGATSAGVMKGLQAVLVFLLTHLVFCGRTGGEEMCFSASKLISLLTVAGGVITYGILTQRLEAKELLAMYVPRLGGYESVIGTEDDQIIRDDIEIEAVK
jgi:drug/metabolite transporter (DMT)-like permease